MSAKNRNRFHALILLAGAGLLLTLLGCDMSVHKEDANGRKGVEINTPFGDLKVKNQADAKDTGLPVYPGATPKPSDHSSGDNKGGNVSLSLLSMKLVVLSYVTDDSSDKVLAWYREQLKPMGTVVECAGSGDVGNFTVHSNKSKSDEDSPVTCDKENRDNGRKVVELKLGTERNQRIVAVSERKDGKPGVEFALVRVVVGKGKEETL